jgi:CHAD domain-containing protein
MIYKGYRIFQGEKLQDTYKRVIREQLKLAADLCLNYAKEPDISTHEIRKSIKRIRAVCRLYEQVTDETAYQQAHERYRKISSLLAEHRLAAVYFSTLGMIRLKGNLPDPGRFAKLSSALQTRHAKITAAFLGQQVSSAVYQLLLEAVVALEHHYVTGCTMKDLCRGLENSYRNGKQHLKIARLEPSAHNLHELRKSVKNLWNQMILIKPLWPPVMGLTIHHLDLLAERLGIEHDIAELGSYLDKERNSRNFKDEALIHVMERKRIQVQKLIFPLAARVFAEKPGTYTSRILAYYKIFLKSPFV